MKEFKQINQLKLAEIMNRLDFFRVLEPCDKRSLIEDNLILLRSYQTDELLIQYGDIGDEFFMLMSGGLDVLTENDVVVAQLKPGQFFGEVAFILNEKRTATIRARDNVIVMVLNHKTLKLMPVGVRDKIKDKLIGGLIQRVSELNQRLEAHL